MAHPTANTVIQHPYQWFQRVGQPLQLQVPVYTAPQPIYSSMQPICPTVIQHPIQLPEKTIPLNHVPAAPIPVYQKPPELYQDYPQRRKTQGVDFNNLILLTKGGVKAKKYQSKAFNQNSKFADPNPTDFDSEFPQLEKKCYCLKGKSSQQDNSYNSERIVVKNKSEPDISQKKRLYRDVLTNSSSTELDDENEFEKTYADLERQALEQYRASEECLVFRYQVCHTT